MAQYLFLSMICVIYFLIALLFFKREKHYYHFKHLMAISLSLFLIPLVDLFLGQKVLASMLTFVFSLFAFYTAVDYKRIWILSRRKELVHILKMGKPISHGEIKSHLVPIVQDLSKKEKKLDKSLKKVELMKKDYKKKSAMLRSVEKDKKKVMADKKRVETLKQSFLNKLKDLRETEKKHQLNVQQFETEKEEFYLAKQKFDKDLELLKEEKGYVEGRAMQLDELHKKLKSEKERLAQKELELEEKEVKYLELERKLEKEKQKLHPQKELLHSMREELKSDRLALFEERKELERQKLELEKEVKGLLKDHAELDKKRASLEKLKEKVAADKKKVLSLKRSKRGGKR